MLIDKRRVERAPKEWIDKVKNLLRLLVAGDLPLGRNKFIFLKAHARSIRKIVKTRSVKESRRLISSHLPLIKNLLGYYSWIW